jgi:2-iminoacetate synthase ThiH
MTSKLVTRALEEQGLLSILASREHGQRATGAQVEKVLGRADVLALGAAADIARRRECGNEAHVYVPSPPLTPPPASASLLVIDARESARGTALLRKIAVLRLTGEIGARIVVDWGAVGLEIAQVALCFGATDLAGPIASRRGLPMLDSEDQKKQVKRREIAGYVERAGFRPVFISTSDSSSTPASEFPRTRAHVEP